MKDFVDYPFAFTPKVVLGWSILLEYEIVFTSWFFNGGSDGDNGCCQPGRDGFLWC